MNTRSREKGIDSRYVRKRLLGEYPPWTGSEVTDTLSSRNYLMFSLDAGSKASVSKGDLKLRDHVFPERTPLATPSLSLQENGNGITFLMPHCEPVPVAEAVGELGQDEALALLETISAETLRLMSSGLFFNNLTPDSIVMIDGELRILPVAYLLPGELIATHPGETEALCRNQLVCDLNALGRVYGLFCEHLDRSIAKDCRELAAGLEGLSHSTTAEDYYSLMERISSFFGGRITRTPHLTLLERRPLIDDAGIRKLRQKARKAGTEERHLIVVRFPAGEGRTSFLHAAGQLMRDEWGMNGGNILGDQHVFSDFDEGDDSAPCDYILMDVQTQDMLLNGYIVDRISREMERCSLAVIAVSEDSSDVFVESLKNEGRANRFKVDEISIPALGEREKIDLAASALPPLDREAFSAALPAPLTLSEAGIRARMYSVCTSGAGSDGTSPEDAGDGLAAAFRMGSVFDALAPEERSVLEFIATFRFEVPLSILQNIYSTEEKGFFLTLQRLLSIGLVTCRAESSSISAGKRCLVYGIRGRSIADRLQKEIPDERKTDLHRSIARILKTERGAPKAYIFYHLAMGGLNEDAAFKGMEIFHLLLGRKKINAINCFSENFISYGLDNHLPAEMRFKLYLELGDYFSLIGNIDKAEGLFRKCREEMSDHDEYQALKGIAIDAIRRECEILEKRGEFKRAESLLKKTLENHGEQVLSSERARLYNDLAWIYYRLGQLSESWENCLLVQKIIDKKQNPKELAESYSLMGAINWNRSKYDEAVYCHKRCLAIREELSDERGIGAAHNNFGLVYRSMGRMKDALDSFVKSMKIKQRINDNPGLAAAHLNIALVYLDLEEIEKAEKNCSMAMSLAEQLGNQQLIAEIWGTMGEIAFTRGDLDKARDCYFRDLHICDRTKSMREKAIVFRRLGELSLYEGKLTETSGLLNQARDLNRKIGSRLETILLDLLEGRILLAEGKRESGRMRLEGTSFELSLLGRKRTAANVTAEIGEIYLEEGNELLAREYLLRAISLASESEKSPGQVEQLQAHLDRKISQDSARIDSDSKRFRALCRVISFIRTIQDSDKLYETVTETARRMMHMGRAALIMQNEGQETFHILAAQGEFESEGILTDKNIISILSLTRQLGYPMDITRSQIPEGKISEEFLATHPGIICAPLWINDSVTGFLYLDSPRKSIETTDEDHSFLVAFSQQIMLALERIFLREQVMEGQKTGPVSTGIISGARERVTFRDIIGKSPAMRQVYDMIESIMEIDTTVLLTGENGSGKDIFARAIHDTGPRRDHPFQHINCATLQGTLLESELFGHEKGAFTGAVKQKVGHFEKAGSGTIYLDEIGEVPQTLQAKLLRVLEEGKFYRVGGTK
ncbi:MAG TPA: sigma 54-interacting transcriptional regulator, partial [Candidatus Krumholzibacterium sp.]|nr:sigma 54-interacting transcriptional regulator [Candidatus Krumholzibacterium sp.]